MISFKCKNCGAEMSVDLKGMLYCPYCQSRAQFSDGELEQYKEFRLNMLNYLRAAADAKAVEKDDTLFLDFTERITFTSVKNQNIVIDYQFYYEEDNVKTYITKSSVVFVFEKKDADKVIKMRQGLGALSYPSADIKNLSKCFPTIKLETELDDGRILVAVSKDENIYPLFAFGTIAPVHTAWIVSRMENMCCVFEYSNIVHGGMSINSIFINPRTHEGFLYGGWWNSRRKMNSMDRQDLYDLRKVASQIMGEDKREAPKLFLEFLKDAPASDAYSDFSKWDDVIELGFGGHKFVKFGN